MITARRAGVAATGNTSEAADGAAGKVDARTGSAAVLAGSASLERAVASGD
ncbi:MULTISPECIES: hypothetical protein [Variovorax]|uniref:hypothetical protein n=1 Tax=Variovorax TaxID=34072 RepID=UPI0021AC4811|nr:hypothetical protein [Variovorax paradoxus]UVH57450.1 hypothetical protein NWF24_32215 [Variovorax paradoxus]